MRHDRSCLLREARCEVGSGEGRRQRGRSEGDSEAGGSEGGAEEAGALSPPTREAQQKEERGRGE